MQLALQQLAPLPLKEKIGNHTSAIWKQDIFCEQGQCIFIQAPSGTGKTTLMHLLYGIRKDYEGSVQWNNKVLAAYKKEELATLRAKDISIIFQDMRLFPGLTAFENLEVKRSLSNTVSAQEVLSWIERLGIIHKKDSLASTLSYGEQQRVSIIRALLQPFKWLLMDEPFSHLDDANIQKAITLIKEVAASNNAGIIIADLEDNQFFTYTHKFKL